MPKAACERQELLPRLVTELPFQELSHVAIVNPRSIRRFRYDNCDALPGADLRVERGFHGKARAEQG
jgi:hypothetical protein